MSKPLHPEHGVGPASERAARLPYVIGFLLSLCFTVIPYNMVGGHLLKGTSLLALILGIAVLQMIIQVVFFLHLGRERKPHWQLYFFAGTIFGVMTVVGGSIFIMAHLNGNMNPLDTSKLLAQNEGISQVEGKSTGACSTIHTEHDVTITNGVVSPLHTDAHACDTLVFTTDGATYDIIFGTNSQSEPYAGVGQVSVSKGHGQMITLSQVGPYHFQDKLHPEVNGTFTVNP